MSDTTLIGGMTPNGYMMRGTVLSEAIANEDVVSFAWLAWMGRRPTDTERRLLTACIVATMDHGMEPPSAHVARTVASCGKSLADAVAAGLLTLGPRHGNAAGAASLFWREQLVAKEPLTERVYEWLNSKKRLPGIGHPEYTEDPRATALYALAAQLLPAIPHFECACAIAAECTRQKGKPLPLNVDGALGALMADLDVPADVADAIFLWARTAGLIAHAREVSEGTRSYHRST